MSKQNKMTRRKFLKDAAVAGAFVATAGVVGCSPATPTAPAAMSANSTAAATPANPTAAPVNPTAAPVHVPGVPDKWDKEVDVIVAGTGFAGVSAAITAMEAGAKVLIIEKAKKEHEGGNSKVSGNMWWTPANAEDGFTYIKALSYGLTEDDSLKALAAEMVKLNDWLSSKFGVKPTSYTMFHPEHPELPGSASENSYNNGASGTSALYLPIRAYVDKIGIEMMFETPAKALVQAPTGEILGVQADSGGKPFFIKARKGVVLATGGFEFNFDMQKQYLPGWPTYGRGTPYNTGDGIKMAQKVGAALWHMNNSLAGFGGLLIPEYAPITANMGMPANGFIMLDKFGQRFMNELRDNRHGFGHKEYQLFFDGILADFTRIPWWTVFDEATRLKGKLLSGPGPKFTWFAANSGYEWSKDNSAEIAKGWILKGDTIADLAAKMKLDPKVLQATIDKYNGYCANGVDADFARPKTGLLPLEKGPFYAMQNVPVTYNTQGGPKRNAKCQVVDPDEKPIARLYSAGEMGSFWGWMYNGGGNNAEALCTGQIAARNVVAETSWS